MMSFAISISGLHKRLAVLDLHLQLLAGQVLHDVNAIKIAGRRDILAGVRYHAEDTC